VVAALRRAGWHGLPPEPQPAWPGLLGLGCSSALAPVTLCRSQDPDCCGEGKGTPGPVQGVPTLQGLLCKSQLELLSRA